MKNFKRLIAVALTAAMVAAIPAAAATEKATFRGQTTRGLERSVNGYAARYKEGGKYVRRTWKQAREYGRNYWFYFDSNTLCVRAKANKNYVNTVAVHTIGGKKYGFDMYGHRVSGIWATIPNPGKNGASAISGMFYCFNEDGTYSGKKTKVLRDKFQFLADVGYDPKTKKDEIDKMFGEPNERETSTSAAEFRTIFGQLRTLNNALFTLLEGTTCSSVSRRVYDNFEIYTVIIGQGKRATERVIAVTAVSRY
jgi:hypothetical protein